MKTVKLGKLFFIGIFMAFSVFDSCQIVFLTIYFVKIADKERNAFFGVVSK